MSKIPRWQTYRLKDLDAYRKRKREYARTPEQRAIRAKYMQKWREKNREKCRQSSRAWHAKNKYRKLDPISLERAEDRCLRSKYGITLDEKVAMIQSQGGCCDICKREFVTERGTHVDHSHITGKIRGIICGPCNTKLGWFDKYSVDIIEYLKVT